MTFKGIDISTHQKPKSIDYDKLAKEIDYVILRVGATGYGKTPPRSNNFFIDAEFEKHYSEFTKRNIPIGVYWYGGAITVAEADQEIDVMLKALKGKKIEYPVYYDVEESRNHGTLSKPTLTNIVRHWLQRVESLGYYVGVYASLYWTNNKFDMDALSKYSLWLAQWGVKQPTKKCDMWQYTSDGKLPGYSGRLDMNIGYVDFKKVITDAGLNHLGAAPKPPVVKPTPKPEAPKTIPAGKFKIGDEVIISGQLYTSSDMKSKGNIIKERYTKITRYVAGAKAPYNTTGDLGWITEAQIKKASSTPKPTAIEKGDKVTVVNNVQYTGGRFTTYFKTYDVIQVNGDRVVIGKGKVVTAAVNIANLKKV